MATKRSDFQTVGFCWEINRLKNRCITLNKTS